MSILIDHFVPCNNRKNRAFMQDNAPSHAAQNTTASLAAIGKNGKKVMVWPQSSPDLNPMRYPWSILKRKIYGGGVAVHLQTATLKGNPPPPPAYFE